jgi:uncharacterized protein YfaP (DUF2135 family)
MRPLLSFSLAIVLGFSGARVLAQNGPLVQRDSTVDVPRKASAPEQELAEMIVLTGAIQDATGAPIPGATAVVDGTTWMTVSNSDGTFSLPAKIPVSTTSVKVRCSYLGLADQIVTVTVNAKNTVIKMAPNPTDTRRAGRARDL